VTSLCRVTAADRPEHNSTQWAGEPTSTTLNSTYRRWLRDATAR
jgi:hypothetical protein